MILFCYGIRDRATDSFDRPMFFVSTGQAVRAFSDEVNRASADNVLHAHPDDYDMYALGSFDCDTGEFKPQRPEQVAIGKNVKLNGKE